MTEKWDPRTDEWVEEYAPFEERRSPARVFVAVGIIVVALALVITAVSAFVAGEADEPSQAAPGDTAAPGPSPAAPTRSAYETFEVERGTANAAVHVVATEPDPAIGQPRIASQFATTEFITSCNIVDLEFTTFPTKAKAKRFAEQSEHGAAWARVEYAEPDWHDKFVVATVTAECP